MKKRKLIAVLLALLLCSPLALARDKKKEAEAVPMTGEQAQRVKAALSSIRMLDTQRQLELERLKVYVLSLQIILGLGPEWEFDFNEMEFRKKTEEKK